MNEPKGKTMESRTGVAASPYEITTKEVKTMVKITVRYGDQYMDIQLQIFF